MTGPGGGFAAEPRARRARTVGALALTVLLAAAAAVGGHAVGDGLRDAGAADRVAQPVPSPSPSPSAPPTAAPSPTGEREALREATRAAVRLTGPTGRGGSGSGSVVSPDGLVLTNAHVAADTAPGLGRLYGEQGFTEVDPPYLLVWTNPPGDGPAVPTFRAELRAADGHLDLAVLQVVATADGGALPADLTLPHVPLGSSADVEKGDDLTVLGFPGIVGGEVLAVSPGSVRTFLPDPFGRVASPRYIVETTAEFSPGNSGGMALDSAGRLVAVPSSAILDGGKEGVARFARAAELAQPLLDAARSGRPYVSPHLVPATGLEQAEVLGWDEGSCGPQGVETVEGPIDRVTGHVVLTGLREDEDVLRILRRDGEVVRAIRSAWKGTAAAACLPTVLDDQDPGVGDGERVLAGEYVMEVRVGPDRRLLATSRLVVTEPAGD